MKKHKCNPQPDGLTWIHVCAQQPCIHILRSWDILARCKVPPQVNSTIKGPEINHGIGWTTQLQHAWYNNKCSRYVYMHIYMHIYMQTTNSICEKFKLIAQQSHTHKSVFQRIILPFKNHCAHHDVTSCGIYLLSSNDFHSQYNILHPSELIYFCP